MLFELLMVFKWKKYTPCAAEQNQHTAEAKREQTWLGVKALAEKHSWPWRSLSATPSPALYLPVFHGCLSLSNSNGCAPINTPGTEVKPAVTPQTQGEMHSFFLMGEI